MEQTIFALATPQIRSGVAIMRISGPLSSSVLSDLTRKVSPKERVGSLRKLYHPKTNQPIDEALVIYFKGPHSFTGEDVVELHIHGSLAVMSQLTEVLGSTKGLRMAEAGEFSRRAFENGKMDLTEAEGLADLINAQTSAQAKQAFRQMHGELGKLYERWRTQLIEASAYLEAYIDFPDEEIPTDITDRLFSRLYAVNKEISQHLDDGHRGELLRNGMHITILGAPNAGKSSLLNYLIKRDISIVSEHAGTTRDVMEAHLDLDGYPVTLQDTAGIRNFVQGIEQEGIRRALKSAEEADFKIALFDATTYPNLDDNTFALIDEHTLIVINKTDLIDNINIQEIKGNIAFLISVKEGRGVDELLREIRKRCKDYFAVSEEPVITQQRHRTLLNQCASTLSAINPEHDIELIAEDLRFAAHSIGKITGRIDVEDILDVLFSQFCIGK